ncbi:hypothetical protein MNB_SUP05-SYMBIONT-4-1000 [hydrothermal vent metagenome]|uniref:Uncharacterized protein n=1 Tax=hydrothermal vent metagenome TaxID=652676 RepID=A0A1W1E744_9ZZZZ
MGRKYRYILMGKFGVQIVGQRLRKVILKGFVIRVVGIWHDVICAL